MTRQPVAALVVVGPDRVGPKGDGPPGPMAPIAGRPMLEWVVDAVVGASIRRVGLVGASLDGLVLGAVTQRTDHALVEQVPTAGFELVETISWAIERVGSTPGSESAPMLLVRGDVPEITSAALRQLLDVHFRSGSAASVLPGLSADPDHVIDEPHIAFDDDGELHAILEPVTPGAPGVAAVCVSAELLVPALRRVTPPGWPHDLLLADAVGAIESAGHHVVRVGVEPLPRADGTSGRAAAESTLRDRIVSRWLERGVLMPDPRQVSIDASVELGAGVELLPGVVLQGNTTIGDGSVIGPNTHVVDASLGADVRAPSVSIHGVEIPSHARLGPFTVHGFPA